MSSAPRGSVNHFLRVGRSSGSRLLYEVRAGEPHISGQDVKLVFCRRWQLSYCILGLYFKLCFTFAVFEL